MDRGQRIALIGVGVVIAVVAVVIAVSSGGGKKDKTTTAATISVVGGKPDGGVQSIDAKKGQTLHLTVNSDKKVPIHMHGYDIEKVAAPGRPAVYTVPLKIDGVFEIEVESTSTQIGKLTVQP